jgi:hypothetical protein
MSDQATTAQAKEKVQEVAGQAQEKAQEAAGQAQDRMREQIGRRSTQAGRQISGHADDLRSVGEQLRNQGKDQPARLADQAAGQLERAGTWLTESDADRIIHDVEDAARKNPWAVMAGGLVLGFAASRMLKASSRDRYQTRSTQGRTPQALPVRSGEDRFSRPVTPATGPATDPATGSGPGTVGIL